MKYVIFSIDDQSPMGVLNFLKHFNERDTKGTVVQCVGSYKGETEWSFLTLWEDFRDHVAFHNFVGGQESVLRISECNKQYAQLLYQDGAEQSLGSLKSVSKEEALKHDAWTYRPDLDVYWIAVQGNPDTVPPQEGWLSQEKKDALRTAIMELRADRGGSVHQRRAADELRRLFFPN